MAAVENAFYDLGKGLGYIYITGVNNTTPTAADIVKVLDNDAEGLREARIYGLQASSLASNRVAVAIHTIDAPTGVGSITNIKVGAVELIDPAVNISYTGATTANDLTQDIVDAINNFSEGSISKDFSATRVDNTLYVFTNPAAGDAYNKVEVAFTSTGFFTQTKIQNLTGGSSSTTVYDSGIGYRFFVDADYDATGCSGAGTATVNSLTNAVEVTNYLVFTGVQGAMPLVSATLSSDTLVKDRKGSLSIVSLTGEGSANDDLNTIVMKNMAIGDRILLASLVNTITLNDYTVASGNVKLQTTTYDIIGSSFIELVYNADGYWYEICRSTQVIGSTADYRTAGYGIFANEDYASQNVATSGTINFTPNVNGKWQKIRSSSTLIGNLSYGFAGTPVDGDEFWVEYDASVTVGAFDLDILGIVLTADQALNGGLIFYARYLNGSWYSFVFPNLNDAGTKFQAATEFYKDASITVSKVETTLKTEVLSRQISFETSETGDMKMYMGYPGTVEYLWFVVDKDLAATDNGTIVPKNNAGTTMTSGTITATAYSTIATSFTSTPTANNTFVAGDVLTFTTAKTTKGGKGTLYIKVSKS